MPVLGDVGDARDGDGERDEREEDGDDERERREGDPEERGGEERREELLARGPETAPAGRSGSSLAAAARQRRISFPSSAAR